MSEKAARHSASNAPLEEHEEPPAYSSAPSASRLRQPPGSTTAGLRPSISSLKFAHYVPDGGSISKDAVTISIPMSVLAGGSQSWHEYLRLQASLPPRPMIRIAGSGMHGKMFDIRLNMLPYFLPPDGGPGLNYVSGVGVAGQPSFGGNALQRQLQAFLSEPSRSKCLVLTRRISNWDTEYLEGRLRTLLADLNYKGTAVIEFPVTHCRVLIKPSYGDKIASFASSFIAAISDSFVTPREFNVEAVWPYANIQARRTDEEADASGTARRCNVCSEQAWWDSWKPVIAQAVLSKHNSWLGEDAWMDYAMGPRKAVKNVPAWGT